MNRVMWRRRNSQWLIVAAMVGFCAVGLQASPPDVSELTRGSRPQGKAGCVSALARDGCVVDNRRAGAPFDKLPLAIGALTVLVWLILRRTALPLFYSSPLAPWGA